MPAYRLYFLDGAAKVASAEWIEAADDAAAIEVAREKCASKRCEVLQRNRLVARISNGALETFQG